MFHNMKQAAYPGTQAVQRAVRLLKACGQGGPGRRLSDLARAVDLNKTTAFRLLSALESAGLVERTPDGEAYQIGAELTRLAGHALGSRALIAAGRPALQALAAATRETITLEVLVDDEVLIVDEVVGSHVIAAMPSLGTRWPAHATSTGKVLLAGLSDLELQRRTHARLPSFTPRTIVSPAALRRELLRVRERGSRHQRRGAGAGLRGGRRAGARQRRHGDRRGQRGRPARAVHRAGGGAHRPGAAGGGQRRLRTARLEAAMIPANGRAVSDVGTQTLPARYYTDPVWYQQELERIHLDMWLYVGRADKIAQPGDYFVYEIANAEVLVVRDERGQVRAFHNVCRHRGTRLCTQASGRLPGRIRCPYHAWTYRLDGTLAQAPHMEKVRGFIEADYPLNPVPLEIWAGYIFINLSERPIPFPEHLAGLDVKFANWAMEDLRVVERRTYQLRANWKLIVQNYHECLHCPTAHPQLNRLSHYLSGDNEPAQPTYLGARMELREGITTLSSSLEPRRQPLAWLDPEQRRNVYYYAILPNMMLNLHPDYVVSYRFDPRGVDRTDVECEWLFHESEARDAAFDASDAIEFWDVTNRQDWELSDLAQIGIRSRGYRPGPYSNREELLAAFDQWVLAKVGTPQPQPHPEQEPGR